MPDLGISADQLRESLRDAEERKAKALIEYQRAEDEIAWLRQGLDLLEGQRPKGGLAQLLRTAPKLPRAEGNADGRPTLRQAIMTVMSEEPFRVWAVGELAERIVQRGWLDADDTAAKRVSDMAGVMVGDGQLARAARGMYQLEPGIAGKAALERAVGEQNDHGPNPFL